MSFWNPVRTDLKTEKINILGLARKQLQKQLQKAEKDVDKKTKKLRELDPMKDSQKKTRNARINLNMACKERDDILRRIEVVDEWRQELQRSD